MEMCYETDRLYLKILGEESSQEVLDFYIGNKAVFEEFEPDRPEHFYSAEYQASLLNCEFNLAVKQSAFRFWVMEKSRPERIIGTVSFHNIVRSIYQSCQLGYKFDQSIWHRGYARESISKALEIIFDVAELHRIEAMVMPSNAPSICLLESLGFINEGVCRSCIYLHGSWTDHLRYSLIHP